MEVSTERFDDSSLPDENGECEYRYTGIVYTFDVGGRKLLFRRYDDEPSTATLLQPLNWYTDLFHTDSFREAVEYLRLKEGVTAIKAYNSMTGTFTEIELPGQGGG